MRIAAMMVCTFCVVGTAHGQFASIEWKTYRYANEGFAADLPNPPRVENDNGPDHVGHNYSARQGPETVFTIVTRKDRPWPFERIGPNPVEACQLKLLLNCAIRSEREVTFPGALAREIIVDRCEKRVGMVLRERLYVAGGWIYQAMVLGSEPGFENGTDANRFLKSFRLIAP